PLCELQWVEVDGGERPAPSVAAIGADGWVGIDTYADLDALQAAARTPDIVLTRGDDAARLEAIVARWASSEGLAGSRLLVAIPRANAVGEDELPDLDAAAVWAVVRGAQAQHPDRFTLLDLDRETVSSDELERVLGAGDEDQLAL